MHTQVFVVLADAPRKFITVRDDEPCCVFVCAVAYAGIAWAVAFSLLLQVL